MKKVLIACEESGTIREEFNKVGWEATSADFRPSLIPGRHYQGDVRDLLDSEAKQAQWDLVIAHPPCECLTLATNSSMKAKQADGRFEEAKEFYEFFTKLDKVPRVCIENPVGHLSKIKYEGFITQIVHPWQFGHAVKKRTQLRIKNLPPLIKTKIIPMHQVWDEFKDLPKGESRRRIRSKTFKGIARAMADQWGKL